jgi:2-keto-4-pentenoate hydratase/2-oxohepta-3-ene-1,7-dioic acid hydratase in catechol pathway
MRRISETQPRTHKGNRRGETQEAGGNVELVLEPLLDVSREAAGERRDEEDVDVAVRAPRDVGALARARGLRVLAVRLDDAHHVALVPGREDVPDGRAAERPHLEDLEERLLPAHGAARVLRGGRRRGAAAAPALRGVAVEEETPARLDAEPVASEGAGHAFSSVPDVSAECIDFPAMKLVSYMPPEGETSQSGTFRRHARVGAVIGEDRILDFARAHPRFANVSMLDLVKRSGELLPEARALVGMASELPREAFLSEATVTIVAPLPRPVSIRDGYAFRQHVETARRNRGLPMIPEFDEFPVFYFTNALAVTGPGELRVGRRRLEKLDFELECFCVIGRHVQNPTLAEADDAIFGYGVMNDFSARALQMEEMKLNLGPAKGKDFATGLGPWLVTKDELKDRLRPSPKGNVLHAAMSATVNHARSRTGTSRRWTGRSRRSSAARPTASPSSPARSSARAPSEPAASSS